MANRSMRIFGYCGTLVRQIELLWSCNLSGTRSIMQRAVELGLDYLAELSGWESGEKRKSRSWLRECSKGESIRERFFVSYDSLLIWRSLCSRRERERNSEPPRRISCVIVSNDMVWMLLDRCYRLLWNFTWRMATSRKCGRNAIESDQLVLNWPSLKVRFWSRTSGIDKQ